MLDDVLRDGHGEDVQVRAQQPVDPDPRRGIHERPLRDRADAQDGGDQLGDRDRSDRTDRERFDRPADLLGLRRTGRFHLWSVEVEGRKADHCDAVHDEEGREQDRGLLEAGSRCGHHASACAVCGHGVWNCGLVRKVAQRESESADRYCASQPQREFGEYRAGAARTSVVMRIACFWAVCLSDVIWMSRLVFSIFRERCSEN